MTKQDFAHQMSDAFRELCKSAMMINEILTRCPELNEQIPEHWPIPASADEWALACIEMSDYYHALAHKKIPTLAEFRASRQDGISDRNLCPSDEPATEEYSYPFGENCVCFIRCERGRYVYLWQHPCNTDAPTLEQAEAELYDWAVMEGLS